MSDMTMDIRVYRAKELRALDFAELMRAAIAGNTVLHGCSIEHNTTTGRLVISDGRLVMHGRLGTITGGDIPMPATGSGTSVNYTLAAICDLNAAPPMRMELLTDDELATIVSAASERTDNEFNTTNGVRYFVFGTATIDRTQNVVTGWTPVADAAVVHNLSYYVDKLTTSIGNGISSLRTELTTKINKVADSGSSAHSVATAMSWINYLRKRVHSTGNFAIDIRTAGTEHKIIVAGGSQVTAYYPKGKNGVTIIFTNDAERNKAKSNYYTDYAHGTAVPTIVCSQKGAISDSFPGNTSSWSTSNDKYGVPLAANPNYTPYAMVGVAISGTNAANCVIQSFGFNSDYAYVRVRNVGSAQASIAISCRILYIQAE